MINWIFSIVLYFFIGYVIAVVIGWLDCKYRSYIMGDLDIITILLWPIILIILFILVCVMAIVSIWPNWPKKLISKLWWPPYKLAEFLWKKRK